jgi:hypothetical protein
MDTLKSITGGKKPKSKSTKTTKSAKTVKSTKTVKTVKKTKTVKPSKTTKPVKRTTSKTTKPVKKTNKNKYVIKYVIGKNGMVYQMKKKIIGGNSTPMDITSQNDDMFILSKETFNKSITAPINSPYDNLMSKNGNYNYNMIENKGFGLNDTKTNLFPLEKPTPVENTNKPTNVVNSTNSVVNSTSSANNTTTETKGGAKKSKSKKTSSKKYKNKFTDPCVKKYKTRGGNVDPINYSCPSTNYEKQFLELDTEFCKSAKSAFDKLNTTTGMKGGKRKTKK